MTTRHKQNGFTLIEILIATAMILTVLSCIYGSYFTISRSTQVTRAKLKLSQQSLNVMTQLTRQIRCCYAETVTDTDQKNIDLFSGSTANPGKEILHLITTNSFGASQDSTQGLFDVTYRFDKRTGKLYLSRQRFTGANKDYTEKKQWTPIAENVHSLELNFFDGTQWLNKWSFKEMKKLPKAVKIDITFTDKADRTYQRSTVAQINCDTDTRS